MTSTPHAPPLARSGPPARGSLPRPTRADHGPPLLPLAAGSALRAALVGLLAVAAAVVVLWWAEDRSGSSAADVARAAGQVWLVAHGAWLDLPTGRLGLTPLGLTLLPVLLCRRAGRRVAEARPDCPAHHVAVAVALPYAASAALVGVAAAGQAEGTLPLVAAGCAFVVGALAAATGSVRGGVAAALRSRVAPPLRAALAGGAAAAAALAAGAALLTAVALGRHAGTAVQLAESSEPGAVGGLGLLLLGAALAPNAVVCAASWLVGPGFALGTGTSVSPFSVELGPVPSLPLLAAVPGGPAPSWLVVLALATPVLAGAVGGAVSFRHRGSASWQRAVVDTAACAAVAGAVLALFALLAGGALGDGHLATVGPDAVRVGPVFAGEVLLGAGLAHVALRRRAARTG